MALYLCVVVQAAMEGVHLCMQAPFKTCNSLEEQHNSRSQF